MTNVFLGLAQAELRDHHFFGTFFWAGTNLPLPVGTEVANVVGFVHSD